MGWAKSLRQQGLAALVAVSSVGYTVSNAANMGITLDFNHPLLEGRISRGVFNDRLEGSYSFSTDGTQMYAPFRGCRKIFFKNVCKEKQIDVVFSPAIDPSKLQGPLEVDLDMVEIGEQVYEAVKVYGADTLRIQLDEKHEVDEIFLTYTTPTQTYTAEGWIYEVKK